MSRKATCVHPSSFKRKADRKQTVCIYLPMVPEAAIAFLACARIGAVHSVVFAGFSAEALRDRIVDCKSRVILTTDEGKRGGKTIATKSIVDSACEQTGDFKVDHVLVLKRTGADVKMTEGRDLWWKEETAKVRPVCPPVSLPAEHPLFVRPLSLLRSLLTRSQILYTSGSTGKPKGVLHSTAGYLLGAAMTVKYVFDTHPGDRFACMADGAFALSISLSKSELTRSQSDGSPDTVRFRLLRVSLTNTLAQPTSSMDRCSTVSRPSSSSLRQSTPTHLAIGKPWPNTS